MDFGLAQKLEGVYDTAYFNQDFETGYGTAQYLLQKSSGFDGAGIRNPVTMRPHKSGGILHAFKREVRVFTVEGILIADGPSARWAAADKLRGITDSLAENTNGTYTVTPPYGSDRSISCRLYDSEDLSGQDFGSAGPKSFAFTFVAGDWRWYSDATDVVVPNGGDVVVPNAGNTPAWLNFKVRTHGSEVLSFSLTNEDTQEMVDWSNDGLPFGLPDPKTGDCNMLDETFYQGNQHDLLGGIVLENTDFFSILPGGATVSYFSDDFDSDVLVETKSAWV